MNQSIFDVPSRQNSLVVRYTLDKSPQTPSLLGHSRKPLEIELDEGSGSRSLGREGLEEWRVLWRQLRARRVSRGKEGDILRD